MADALERGGAILMAHANLVSDNPSDTGFDWEDHTLAAKTIGETFSTIECLQLARELRTPLYRIQLFQKVETTTEPDVVLLPLEVQMPITAASSVIWNVA